MLPLLLRGLAMAAGRRLAPLAMRGVRALGVGIRGAKVAARRIGPAAATGAAAVAIPVGVARRGIAAGAARRPELLARSRVGRSTMGGGIERTLGTVASGALIASVAQSMFGATAGSTALQAGAPASSGGSTVETVQQVPVGAGRTSMPGVGYRTATKKRRKRPRRTTKRRRRRGGRAATTKRRRRATIKRRRSTVRLVRRTRTVRAAAATPKKGSAAMRQRMARLRGMRRKAA